MIGSYEQANIAYADHPNEPDDQPLCPECGCVTWLNDEGEPDYCLDCERQWIEDAAVAAAESMRDDGPGWHPADDRHVPP